MTAVQKPIKQIIKTSGLFQWQIAEQMNVSEFTFSKWMRHEPNEELRNRIIEAINTLQNQ